MTTTIPDIINEDISKAFALNRIPEGEQARVLLAIHNIIFQGVLLAVVRRLSATGLAAFEKLMERDANGEEVASFLEKEIPDLGSIIIEEIARFKRDGKEALAPLFA